MKPLTRRQLEAVKELRRIGGCMSPWSGTDGPRAWKKFAKRTWKSLEEKGYITVERGDIDVVLDRGLVTVSGAVVFVMIVEGRGF